MKSSTQGKTHAHTTADCDICETKNKSFMCATSEEISAIISKIKADCRYKAGDIIFRAGDSPLGLFSVRSGVVKLETLNDEGAAHTVRIIGPGGLLGYRSFFKGEPYKKSAIVMEATEVCFLPRKEVMEMFRCHPELSLKMINQLTGDLDQAESKWVDQIDKGAPARVADALIFLDENFKDSSWTRKEIAEWAGTTTETVIRTLGQFEKEGIISQNYKNFNILSAQKLTDKANS